MLTQKKKLAKSSMHVSDNGKFTVEINAGCIISIAIAGPQHLFTAAHYLNLNTCIYAECLIFDVTREEWSP